MKKFRGLKFSTEHWTLGQVIDIAKRVDLGGEARWSSDEPGEILLDFSKTTAMTDELLADLEEGVEPFGEVVEMKVINDDVSADVEALLAKRSTEVTLFGPDGVLTKHHLIRKTYAAEIEKDSGDASSGRLGITITTDEVDRYEDVIPADLWDFGPYMKNPIVLFNHDYGVVANSPPSQGKTLSLKAMKHKVKSVVQFHRQTQFNEELYSLYRGGYMNADSVGFRSTSKPEVRLDADGHSIGGLLFTGQELMEHSLVAVGANAGALQDAATKGVIRQATRDYLGSMSPLAGDRPDWVKGNNSDQAAPGDEDLVAATLFEGRATLAALHQLRRIK